MGLPDRKKEYFCGDTIYIDDVNFSFSSNNNLNLTNIANYKKFRHLLETIGIEIKDGPNWQIDPNVSDAALYLTTQKLIAHTNSPINRFLMTITFQDKTWNSFQEIAFTAQIDPKINLNSLLTLIYLLTFCCIQGHLIPSLFFLEHSCVPNVLVELHSCNGKKKEGQNNQTKYSLRALKKISPNEPFTYSSFTHRQNATRELFLRHMDIEDHLLIRQQIECKNHPFAPIEAFVNSMNSTERENIHPSLSSDLKGMPKFFRFVCNCKICFVSAENIKRDERVGGIPCWSCGKAFVSFFTRQCSNCKKTTCKEKILQIKEKIANEEHKFKSVINLFTPIQYGKIKMLAIKEHFGTLSPFHFIFSDIFLHCFPTMLEANSNLFTELLALRAFALYNICQSACVLEDHFLSSNTLASKLFMISSFYSTKTLWEKSKGTPLLSYLLKERFLVQVLFLLLLWNTELYICCPPSQYGEIRENVAEIFLQWGLEPENMRRDDCTVLVGERNGGGEEERLKGHKEGNRGEGEEKLRRVELQTQFISMKKHYWHRLEGGDEEQPSNSQAKAYKTDQTARSDENALEESRDETSRKEGRNETSRKESRDETLREESREEWQRGCQLYEGVMRYLECLQCETMNRDVYGVSDTDKMEKTHQLFINGLRNWFSRFLMQNFPPKSQLNNRKDLLIPKHMENELEKLHTCTSQLFQYNFITF